jgi:dihydroxyacetone kinase phosphoprotein-dependent L subunit
MTDIETLRAAVRAIADTAIENEKYFCELDAATGDGDFGYSLARGFEAVLEKWDTLNANDTAAFLREIATTLSGRLGGTSGPIWGTAFLRAGMSAGTGESIGLSGVLAMLDAAIAGIQKRGGASVGDKTLLDALCPVHDELATWCDRSAAPAQIANSVAAAAHDGAERTKDLVAHRGRASYVGERSLGHKDPGAVAVATMATRIAALWNSSTIEDAATHSKETAR